jgi:predicted MPP superfamily phosphohydrolase
VFAGRLRFGQKGSLHIREEHLAARGDPCRLLYISDIHLRRGRSPSLCRQVVEAAQTSAVEAVLLGGDLVDSAAELDRLKDLVRQLAAMRTVLAVGGNHDQRVGMARVRDAVIEAGGQWIHEGSICLKRGSRTLAICGPEAAHVPAADTRILCAHNPRVWKTARERGYDLVLAGHLHGCQMVAFEYRDRLFPGALFYPYCYLSHQYLSTRLVVSRGVSDLVPIRWRCPREVVLCHV